MSLTAVDFRPAGRVQPAQADPAPKIRVRDLVTWTDPATGAEWPELLVEFVYPIQGRALCRGFFGCLSQRSGEPLLQSHPLPLAQLEVTGHADEVQ